MSCSLITLLYSLSNSLFLANIRSIKSSILDQNHNNIVKTLLYGLDSLCETEYTSILNATMEFLISSNRFEKELYWDHMNEQPQIISLNLLSVIKSNTN